MRRYGVLAVLIALCFLMPSGAPAVGTLSIPNIIANQPAGNLQSSLLDSNWNAIRDYVNNREIASGTLSARPAASTAGRFYFATDVSGGTLYFDNGSAWTALAPGVQVTGGTSLVRGLQAATATSTNTTVNTTATQVVLRSPSDGTLIVRTTDATATLTNSILTAGPTANGRDVVAAFSPPTWVHFYYIWNGTTLSTLSSTCSPSDVNGSCSANFGPTLPTGYTHVAYIGALRMATAGTINSSYIRGNKMYPGTSQAPINTQAISASEITTSLTSYIPPNAMSFALFCSSSTTVDFSFGVAAGNYLLFTTVGGLAPNNTMFELPNVSQQMFWKGSAGTGTLSCDLNSFTIPNGG